MLFLSKDTKVESDNKNYVLRLCTKIENGTGY
jgi:hypothetical protein